MKASRVSQVRNGTPAQLQLTWLKQSVLDGIPFAASGWVVADGHCESEPIADLHLETLFPSTDTAAITATGVCQHQEVVARPGGVAVALPQRCDGIDGERWRIARGAKIDEAMIGRDVVHAVRHGPSVRVAGEVVHVDGDRLERPGLASVLEVAHELPTSCFFLVSVLMIGSPAAVNLARCTAM